MSAGSEAAPEPEPEPAAGPVAMTRYRVLAPYLDGRMSLTAAAAAAGVPYRTAQRWHCAWRAGGLAALERAPRSDRGRRRTGEDLVKFIEGLALRKPRVPVTVIHRQALAVAAAHGWPAPGYGTVHQIVAALDPGLVVMAHLGAKRYREVYELVYRREAKAPNEIWQADHTQLDLWVLDDKGKPQRPWLTVIEDDHSRAVAGYAVALEAPAALSTALAFRHAIWRKPEPDWHVCGIPTVFHLDHGPDFTSTHLEQVMADLKVQPVFTKKGQPHGHGKIERLIGTFTVMCLPHLPGYAPRGTPDRAGQAQLTLPQLDEQINRFIRTVYNRRPHSETRQAPQTRWEAGAFIPRMPDSLEQLDLLLTTVATGRKIHTDGIHFLNLRYLDPVLADYVTETVTIRYDPRDITEIRVWLRTTDGEKFLCRAICPELSERTISLKEITAARTARRRELRGQLSTRAGIVDKLLAAHSEPLPAAYPAPTPLASYTTSGTAAGNGSGPQATAAELGPSAATPEDRAHTPRLRLYWNE
ncbi:Mu transposase C-terminal domain-containing protein [Streptomyces sp. NPDC059193]|uniref:Mu transposase C-terminal domain-containing protein n=1 Tax=Streptomyces sp. NPDC059193 TaxID=3346763 RepID=UPI0036D143FF